MNGDIEFGNLHQAQPQRQAPPDQDKSYLTAALGAPCSPELPIYVDLDVMRVMEEHAQSDRTIELGGVLLGGQFVDSDNRPFVVINECLQAEHYEATRGSFKFTHETWERITRQRQQFSPNLQMVGWYHTHPGWGVFLSGMDVFICENFFNKPLDVALVIDPCRGDRGMFQWTGEVGQPPRRTSGFHLFTSRFRESELEHYASRLQEEPPMAREPFTSPRPTTAANIWKDPSQGLVSLAILAILGMQFAVLALIAWRMTEPMRREDPVANRSGAAVANEFEMQYRELEAQRRFLNSVIEQLGGQANLASQLEEQRSELEAAKAALRGQDALRSQLEQGLRTAQFQAEDARQTTKKLQTDLQRNDAALAEAMNKIDGLTGEPAGDGGNSSAELFGRLAKLPVWQYGLIALGVLGFAAWAVSAALARRNRQERSDEPWKPPTASTGVDASQSAAPQSAAPQSAARLTRSQAEWDAIPPEG